MIVLTAANSSRRPRCSQRYGTLSCPVAQQRPIHAETSLQSSKNLILALLFLDYGGGHCLPAQASSSRQRIPIGVTCNHWKCQDHHSTLCVSCVVCDAARDEDLMAKMMCGCNHQRICKAGMGSGTGHGLSSLDDSSDSIYVLGVEIAADDAGSMIVVSSPLERVMIVPGQEDCGVRDDAGRGAKSGVGRSRARGSGVGGVSSNASSSKNSTTVHVKFCRVEDVLLIMQACRVFFLEVDSLGGQIQIEFPRGQVPMW